MDMVLAKGLLMPDTMVPALMTTRHILTSMDIITMSSATPISSMWLEVGQQWLVTSVAIPDQEYGCTYEYGH